MLLPQLQSISLLLSEKILSSNMNNISLFVIPALMANGAYHYTMDKDAFFGPGEAYHLC